MLLVGSDRVDECLVLLQLDLSVSSEGPADQPGSQVLIQTMGLVLSGAQMKTDGQTDRQHNGPFHQPQTDKSDTNKTKICVTAVASVASDSLIRVN